MRLYAALLTSLALHIAVITGPDWIKAKPPPAPQPRIEVSLPPPTDNDSEPADAVSTETKSAAIAPTAPPPTRELKGESLRLAQAALTRHLFYPPEAIARGMEGEVILLLSTDRGGVVVAVDIARSSGHTLLDRAAIDAAQRIGRLPGAKRQMLFPVKFHLQ